MNYQQCRSCKADVLWLEQAKSQNPKSRPNPVNAHPDPEKGNLQIFPNTGVYLVVPKNRIGEVRAEGVDLHTSHFESCPDAGSFRKKIK